MSTAVYLYGFVPATAPTPEIPGVDGRPVEVVEVDEFAAAVTELEGDDWSEAGLEAHLKDLGWVGGHGARHETVVTWFSDHATIVPARLLTVFSSLDALRTEARERAPSIEDLLERFRDDREWDLKVSYDPETLISHLGAYSEEAARDEEEIQAAPPGRRYLLERSRDETSRARAAEVVRGLARDLLSRLAELSREVMEVELPQLRGEGRVVLNAALLVAPDRAEELGRLTAEESERVGGHGVRIDLTGPWAPYRFMPGESDG